MTVLDKVLAAIGTLAEPGGASRPAIAKAVSAADGEVGAALLKAALSKGVAKGLLTQAGQRFALAGVTVAPREVAQVDSVVLKEGSGDPCGAGDTVSMAYVGSLQVGRHSAHDCMHTARTPGRCRRSTSRRRVALSSAHSLRWLLALARWTEASLIRPSRSRSSWAPGCVVRPSSPRQPQRVSRRAFAAG